jgi:hypothetical protein
LRQKIADLQAYGLEPKAAFDQAAQELGSAEHVASEFQKLGTRIWRPIKIVVALESIAAPLAIALVVFRLRDKPLALLLGAHVFSITMGYLTALLVGAVAGCFILRRCFSDFAAHKARQIVDHMVVMAAPAAVLTGIGTVLAMIWANLTWGRAWAWDPKETGAACILWWLIILVACGRSRRIRPHVIMLLAVIGNIIVSLGWFGANMVATRANSPIMKAQLLALIVVHLLLLALGTLPAGWLRIPRDKHSA